MVRAFWLPGRGLGRLQRIRGVGSLCGQSGGRVWAWRRLRITGEQLEVSALARSELNRCVHSHPIGMENCRSTVCTPQRSVARRALRLVAYLVSIRSPKLGTAHVYIARNDRSLAMGCGVRLSKGQRIPGCFRWAPASNRLHFHLLRSQNYGRRLARNEL